MHTYVFCSWPSSSAQETSVILYFALCSGPRFSLQNHLPGAAPFWLTPTHPGHSRPERESRKTDWSASAEARQGPLVILLGAP